MKLHSPADNGAVSEKMPGLCDRIKGAVKGLRVESQQVAESPFTYQRRYTEVCIRNLLFIWAIGRYCRSGPSLRIWPLIYELTKEELQNCSPPILL